MKQGRAGRAPRTMKEIKVAIPHFKATTQSITTSPNYSNIMILTKACLLVARRSAMRLQSSTENPFQEQMSMISFFQSFNKCQTSYISLAYSALMYQISALADKQSPRPIPIPSPTMAAAQKAMILELGVDPAMAVRIMIRVLMLPSNPPQTIDFSNSPASMCSSA